MHRREFLRITGTGAAAISCPPLAADTVADTVARPIREIAIRAKPGRAHIVGPDFPATAVWGYDGQVPGTPIRLVHGQTLAATVHNELDMPTTVHWHGIRLPNAMDGVAGLTQPAIAPGESFDYRFTPPDAGTFWYHSHTNAHEQIGRGLYGPLVIEEKDPPEVDRDLVLMIDDWRLLDDASIREDFASGHDRSHAGRIGNVPTVNGRFRDVLEVRKGERLRLRLINASNARNFALDFAPLQPRIIAIDGQPLPPYRADEEIIVPTAGRVDLIVDITAEPGSILAVSDTFYRRPFDLFKFAIGDTPLRSSPLEAEIALNRAHLPEPDPSHAKDYNVILAGGAMGGLQRAMMDGKWMSLRDIARQGYVWALNDIVGNDLDIDPLIDVPRGTDINLTIDNRTAFPHPMHLHGHHLKLLSIDDRPVPQPHWVDSPLVMPQQKMQFAFVADNPGKWLFHCHVLEHHAAGMGSIVRVS